MYSNRHRSHLAALPLSCEAQVLPASDHSTVVEVFTCANLSGSASSNTFLVEVLEGDSVIRNGTVFLSYLFSTLYSYK